MDKNKTTAGGGVGFLGALTILFIVLKLLGKISWSWAWVLAPIWIPAVIGVGIFAIVFVVAHVKGW